MNYIVITDLPITDLPFPLLLLCISNALNANAVTSCHDKGNESDIRGNGFHEKQVKLEDIQRIMQQFEMESTKMDVAGEKSE